MAAEGGNSTRKRLAVEGLRWKAILASGLLISSWTAQASEWWFIATGEPNPHSIFVDRSTIRELPNGWRRAWVMTVFEGPPRKKQDTEVLRQLYDVDCQNSRSSMVASMSTTFDGTITDDPVISGWIYSAPDSGGAEIEAFVCRGEGRFAVRLLPSLDPIQAVRDIAAGKPLLPKTR